MIIGAVYIWMVYIQPQMRSRPGGSGSATPSGMWLVFGAAALLLIAMFSWFIESGPSSLALDEAESDFILPAPVSRRQLVGYKVLRGQVAVVTTVLIWTVLTRRGTQNVEWSLRVIGIWIFFTTTSLHRIGAELARARWATRGINKLRQHWGALGVIAVIVAGLTASGALHYANIAAASQLGPRDVIAAVADALRSGPAGVVLWPIHALLGPLLAPDNMAWMLAAPGAIAVLVAHAIWIATADPRSIEAAVAKASDKSAMIRRTRIDRAATTGAEIRRKPNAPLATMPLAPLGWPGVAIIWKNILCLRRKARPTTLVLLMALPLIIGVLVASGGLGLVSGIAIAGFGAVAMLILFGPILMRTDLRTDMVNIVALKLIPLSGRTIVAAEVLSVVVPLGLVQAAILIVTAVGSMIGGDSPLTPSETLVVLAGAIPFIIIFNAAFVAIQNTAPVLFPAWAKLGATGGGMEAIGQMVIVVSIVGGLLALMLLVPGAVAAGIVFAGRSHIATAIAGGLIAAGLLLTAEVVGVIALLGRALERTEPSDVAAS